MLSVQKHQAGFDEVEARLLGMCLFLGYVDSQNESYGSLCGSYVSVSCLKETAAFFTLASL
jgi:hypothetical protein